MKAGVSRQTASCVKHNKYLRRSGYMCGSLDLAGAEQSSRLDSCRRLLKPSVQINAKGKNQSEERRESEQHKVWRRPVHLTEANLPRSGEGREDDENGSSRHVQRSFQAAARSASGQSIRSDHRRKRRDIDASVKSFPRSVFAIANHVVFTASSRRDEFMRAHRNARTVAPSHHWVVVTTSDRRNSIAPMSHSGWRGRPIWSFFEHDASFAASIA